MKKKYVAFLCGAAIPLLLASCASKPKPAPESEPVQEEIEEVPAAEETPAEEPQVNQDDEEARRLAEENARKSALEKYQNALAAKAKIDENGFASYDQADYDSGSESLSAFSEKKDSDSSAEELLALADDAYGKFLNVLNRAYKKLAKDARTQAFVSKRNADSVKAGVAAKEDYAKATEEFKSGDTNYAMQNPESAYNHYVAAKEQFDVLYGSISEKRAAAQKAIDEAKAKVEESTRYALNADSEKPLTEENVEGIESEDAVLLEQEEYAAPETMEADIPEYIDGEEDADASDDYEEPAVAPAEPTETASEPENVQTVESEPNAEEPAAQTEASATETTDSVPADNADLDDAAQEVAPAEPLDEVLSPAEEEADVAEVFESEEDSVVQEAE